MAKWHRNNDVLSDIIVKRDLPKQFVGDLRGFYGDKLYSEAYIEPLKIIGRYYTDRGDRADIKKRWLNAFFDVMERILLGEYHESIALPSVKKALSVRIDVPSLPQVENMDRLINTLALKHLEMLSATLGYMVTMGLAMKVNDHGNGGVFTTDYILTDFDIGSGIIKFERLD